MRDLRDDPRFIMMMDEYVALRAKGDIEYDPRVAAELRELAFAIESEFGPEAIEEAEFW